MEMSDLCPQVDYLSRVISNTPSLGMSELSPRMKLRRALPRYFPGEMLWVLHSSGLPGTTETRWFLNRASALIISGSSPCGHQSPPEKLQIKLGR